ncbi:MAG: hypothetical protein K2O10_03775 [Muribaculaceae bacterium]|nr:hypothetical protein [Muribaculaceae bacterium]
MEKPDTPARRITKSGENSNPVIRSFIASFDVASYNAGNAYVTQRAFRHFLLRSDTQRNTTRRNEATAVSAVSEPCRNVAA